MTEPKHKLTEGDELIDVDEDTNVLVDRVYPSGSVTLVAYESVKGEPEEKVKLNDTRMTLNEEKVVMAIVDGILEGKNGEKHELLRGF